MSGGKVKKGKTVRNLVIAIVILVVVIGFLVGHYLINGWTVKTDTTELGFKNVGELVTQEVDAREVQSYEGDPEKIFGISLPFTQSHYIYSYMVIIKAGFNFEDINYEVDNDAKTITVNLPEPYVISSEIDHDSFETYEEKNNVFDPFTPEIDNELQNTLTENAKNDAIANGLYEKATENAKTVITEMVSQLYDINSDSASAYKLIINTASDTGSSTSSSSTNV